MRALYKKELTDCIDGMRFYALFFLLFVVSALSLRAAASSVMEMSGEETEFMFLKLYTTGGSNIYSFATFLAFLGPLVGITLGFDAISSERSQGTLIRLCAQPIYRDAIINAKFLAGSTAIFILTGALTYFLMGAGILVTGLHPSAEEVARITCYWLLSSVYISFWLALAMIFSVICKHPATAALTVLAIWLFFTFFMSLAAGGLADLIFPAGEDIAGYANLMKNYQLELGLNRISPYYLFNEAATTILNPNTRSIGVVTAAQADLAVASSLSLSQSLLLVWPHLVAIIAMAVTGFAVSYVIFMKQEVRA